MANGRSTVTKVGDASTKIPDVWQSRPLNGTEYGRAPQRTGNDYVCGAIASFVNITVTFPINKVMFRQQMYGIRFFKAFRHIRREGVAFLFRGMLPPMLQRTATVSVMFGTYHNYKSYFTTLLPSHALLVHMTAAMLAGCTEAILAPLERIQSILQIRDYHGELRNTFHAFEVISGYGIRELYRGTSAVLWRNGPSNVIFFGLRDRLKESLPKPESEAGEIVNAFISGAGLGAFLSTMFFPLNVVKARMQARLGGPFPGIRETFWLVYEERDFRPRKMFRGVHINYTRSFLSWGIINAVYELLKAHLTW